MEETFQSDIEVSPSLIIKGIKTKELDILKVDTESYNQSFSKTPTVSSINN